MVSLRARRVFLASYYAANKRTVWAACRAVIFGCIIICVGLAMTVLGYFDKHFSEKVEIIDGSEKVSYDRMIQYQLKSMQYLGPILMGIGSFILIIACVVTLESRDKHAQIITEESILQKRRRLISEEEEKAEHNDVFIDDDEGKESFFGDGRRFVTLDANRLAPLADVDSLTDISLTHRGGSESRLQSDDATVPPPDDQFFQESELQEIEQNDATTSGLVDLSTNPQDDAVTSEDLGNTETEEITEISEISEKPKKSSKTPKLRLEILASEME
ncbi:uncharacterized protein CELE_R05D7.3 [Caenorhabditis elegans]|uniref:Uncharacterized protein n=1 Tax=Caenorhabditis elegans TaxID=6239 RepID=J7SF94_CAEEL|nr:Uncharacterized protein CELE_R05D7.3 [Caenorhabditis elegans]CCM09425.1 Uncharacterized protein CELE_R05D7.3 [Caenorhabditis elegans]|eukprot:NP_001263528.1 Uncharacterized protein CELE_R05D7.3 [Caenorhabditis elegans]